MSNNDLQSCFLTSEIESCTNGSTFSIGFSNGIFDSGLNKLPFSTRAIKRTFSPFIILNPFFVSSENFSFFPRGFNMDPNLTYPYFSEFLKSTLICHFPLMLFTHSPTKKIILLTVICVAAAIRKYVSQQYP